jgi:hypothetical protein
MKIRNLATLAFIGTTFVSTVLAQDEKITTSKEFEYKVGEPYPVVDAAVKSYTARDGSVISFKMNSRSVTIQKFSGSPFSQESSKVYEDFPDGTVYEDDIETEDFVYLLYSVWDKANKVEQLYVRAINLKTAEFENKGERIVAVEGKVTGGDGNKFKLATSFDGSKLLVRFRKKPESRNDKINKDVIGLYVFDSKLTQMWGKDVEMPYTEARMDNIDYAIGTNGDVFILTEVMKEGETRKFDRDDNPNYDYQLISISESGVDVNASDIDVKGKYVTQVNFFEGKDDALMIAGFYGNKRGIQTDGIFYCALNKDGKQADFKNFEIPLELIKLYMKERAQERLERKEDNGKDLGMTNMVLRDILINDDGSIFFAAEKFYVRKTTTTTAGAPGAIGAAAGRSTTQYDFYFEEMLVAKIGKDGELVYMKKLPKRQHWSYSSTQGYFSIDLVMASSKLFRSSELGYKLVESKGNYYLMFLDNVKNMKLDENKVPAKHEQGKGGFLTAYQINKESGNVKKLSILDLRDAQGYELFQFSPKRIVELGNDEFALECYIKKKQDIMIRIKIVE